MQYCPGDMGISRISMSQYLANLCHTTCTGPHTMLGLSVGFPAASAWPANATWPPSRRACRPPRTRWPSSRPAPRSSGGVPQVGQDGDAAALDLCRLGVLVLVDEVLVDAEVHQLVDLRLLPRLAEGGQVLARVAVEEQLVGDRLERLGRRHLLAGTVVSRGGRPTCPGRRRSSRSTPPGRSPSCATASRPSCRLSTVLRPTVPAHSSRGRPNWPISGAAIGCAGRRRRPLRGEGRSGGDELQACPPVTAAGEDPALRCPRRGRRWSARSRDGPPASNGAGGAPWCGSGTPGSPSRPGRRRSP